MIVAEFIEWLKTQDQKAIVNCLVNKPGGYYEQGGTCSVEEFTPDLSDYVDFSSNPHTKPESPWYGKSFLLIGEH